MIFIISGILNLKINIYFKNIYLLNIYCIIYIIYEIQRDKKILKNDGWQEVRQQGSHKHFKHPFKKILLP